LLSYRHSFHAGNFADLLKHIVLIDILEHLLKKDKPFEYIDTHAGAGLYDLRSKESQKLQEYANGIGKLARDDYPELARYFEVVDSFNPSGRLDFYPGSPEITQYFLRPEDRSWLFELHPQDHDLLANNMKGSKTSRVHFQDGFEGLNALLPPTKRRGMVLIDPSYEIKSDYKNVVDHVVNAYKKFSGGTYAIWYPVVNRQDIDKLEGRLVRSGIKNIQRFELGIAEDSIERGMTSSGMIVINPPWQLFEKMSSLLPKLAQDLGENDEQYFKCDILVDE